MGVLSSVSLGIHVLAPQHGVVRQSTSLRETLSVRPSLLHLHLHLCRLHEEGSVASTVYQSAQRAEAAAIPPGATDNLVASVALAARLCLVAGVLTGVRSRWMKGAIDGSVDLRRHHDRLQSADSRCETSEPMSGTRERYEH